ncbi:hypothetical protein [Ruicaihuangia caeni]|uniref:hypothetical protein n=1 Tax=Ruicaihuangia caeni TaxID=3042517 RepID=UPI00338E7833
MNLAPGGTALIIVLSEARSDPRVRRKITWLTEAGWSVDTLALGPTPSDEVRDHFALGTPPRWTTTRLGSLLLYGLLPSRTAFKRFAVSRFPEEARSRIAAGHYDLIVFDDTDYIPVVKVRSLFTRATARAHVHLDLHEFREPRLRLTPWRLLTRRYYRWHRRIIGAPVFQTRSTVSGRIADLYAADFGFQRPTVIRSIPPYHDLSPKPVDPSNIRLLFHGLASWARGFDQIFDAMRELDDRFTMTFMLTGNPANIRRVEESARAFGDRVRVVPAVPMTRVSTAVNDYDLEIIFLPPVTRNVEYALPNKLFEAVQGRLGVVIGRSPMMLELVEQYSLGPIIDGWTGRDLAAGLSSLTAEQVSQFKENADRAAHELSAEREGERFRALVGIAQSKSSAAP